MTKTAKIIVTNDSMDCETCGGDWSTSYQLEIDGVILGQEAYAHCYNSESTDERDLLYLLLEHLGYTVIEEVVDEQNSRG